MNRAEWLNQRRVERIERKMEIKANSLFQEDGPDKVFYHKRNEKTFCEQINLAKKRYKANKMELSNKEYLDLVDRTEQRKLTIKIVLWMVLYLLVVIIAIYLGVSLQTT